MKMLNLLMLTIFLLQLLMPSSLATAETTQPYCYRNITETTYKMVTKTRLKNVNSKNFFKKLISKKDTQIEMYEDLEPMYKIKLQRYCCEGYKMTEYDQCEPQCLENGCPENSKCVEPEVCECSKGYFSARSVHDGKHICQPICEKPCPEHSECMAPNKCACKKGYYHENFNCLPHCNPGCGLGGTCVAPNKCSCREDYKLLKDKCVPVCSHGDHCANGECIAKDTCICNYGYEWNHQTLKCELDGIETTTYYSDLNEYQHVTNPLMLEEIDTDYSNSDVDPSQVFEENSEVTSSEVTDEYDSTAKYPLAANHKCPEDYVFYNGQCLPLKFVSNDIDCWQTPCLDKNAECLENGTCACTADFVLIANYTKNINSSYHTITTVCLTPAEYEARIQKINENPEILEIAGSNNWISIFFIVLGILILTFALAFFGIRLLRRQTGEIDVEGKNLACAYDHRTEKSTI